MQDRDYDWFMNHYTCLYEKYGETYLAIKNQSVIGVYSSYAEGVRKTSENEELGTFIIQRCTENKSDLINYIYSVDVM